MKGLTAEQLFPSVKVMLSQLDNVEREKLEKMILGEVESFNARVARITAELNQTERYSVLPRKKTIRKTRKTNKQ